MASDEPPEPEPVELPLDGVLDLHPFHPRDLPSVLDEYLGACQARGVLALRIIHGKGKGVQQARVQSLLEQDPRVKAWRSADEAGGGWGATLVDLWPAGRGPG